MWYIPDGKQVRSHTFLTGRVVIQLRTYIVQLYFEDASKYLETKMYIIMGWHVNFNFTLIFEIDEDVRCELIFSLISTLDHSTLKQQYKIVP